MSIEARALCKAWDGKLAVDHVSFVVAAGEVYGLIGPNGAGKTTTQRMLAGLLAPGAGQALVAGIDISADPVRGKRELGFHTGTAGLYERLTVRELLRYYGELAGMTAREVAARTEELASTLHFEKLLERRCGKLSTGERQRVSLARASLHDPLALILDEPTAGLDVLASRFVADYIRAARDRGTAVLFSTHYMTEAELLCDRIGLIHDGRLLDEGPPAELRGEEDSLEAAFLARVGAVEAEGEEQPGAADRFGADSDSETKEEPS
ncbi:MAG: ATP-binding cassette domain-containing protein [Myxococcales bacterium]|nr:ATP-binding cassette domain-containing protein [Myxococcales bacterium]